MSYLDLAIERSKRRRHRRCRITLHQNPVGLFLGQDLVNAKQYFGCELAEGMIIAHQIQVIIWLNIEQCQHLIEHFAVLCRDADNRLNVVMNRPSSQFPDNRRHLDCFWAGAKH